MMFYKAAEWLCRFLILSFQLFVASYDMVLLWNCNDGISLLLGTFVTFVVGMQLCYWLTIWNGPGYVKDYWNELCELACFTARKCEVCSISRPKLCHHCSKCKKCILRMDHHCIWLGSCIGYGNIANFLRFLLYSLICCAMHVLITIVVCKNDGNGYLLSGKQVIIIAINFVLCGTVSFLLLILLLKMLINLLNGESTIESMQRKGAACSDQSKSALDNMKEVFGNNYILWIFPNFGKRSLYQYSCKINDTTLTNFDNYNNENSEEKYLIRNV